MRCDSKCLQGTLSITWDLPIFNEISTSKIKFFLAPSTLYRGRLTDKLIEKLGLLQLVLEHFVAVSGIKILM